MPSHTTQNFANADQRLGHLAVQIPGATAIFRKLKLDFCCRGQQTLANACAEKGLKTKRVLCQIQALEHNELPPLTSTSIELIDHILARYHEVHRQQLPELIRMARRVEAVHREHPQVPTGLADQLETMQEELLEHMAKEETILFPLLKLGQHPMAVHPIGMMRHEHINHGAELEKLAELTTRMQHMAGTVCRHRKLERGPDRTHPPREQLSVSTV